MTRSGPHCSSGKRWTPHEDDVLREVAPSLRYNQMGQILPGRSRKAVRARLLVLGLYRATARSIEAYTLMEVAGILGISWSAVRWWVDDGKIPVIRVASLKVQTGRGGRVLVIATDLDDFISRNPFLFSLASFPEGPHKATLIAARPQDWLNRQQAAQLLRIDPHSLDCLARQGKIGFRRFGQRVRFFHRRDIERYRDDRAHRLAQNAGYRRRWASKAARLPGAAHRRVS